MKPVTQGTLEKSALRYLERRPSSRSNLQRILTQKAAGEPESERWIAEILERCEALGYLNDAEYSRSSIRVLRGKGASARRIRAKLREKGIDESLIDELLAEEPSGAEQAAAERYVERRRYGQDPVRKQKDLGALARAGFDYDVAHHALGQGLRGDEE